MDLSIDAADDLGQPVKEYGAALWMLGGLALLSTAVTLILVVLFITAEDLDSGCMVAACGFLAPFVALTIYRIVLLFTNFNNLITIFEDGMSISQYGKKYRFRWEDIDRIYHVKVIYRARTRAMPLHGRIPIFLGESHRIILRDRTEVFIRGQYEKFYELADTVHQTLAEHQISQAIETLKGGGFLDFETMRITREGIRFRDGKNSRLTWSDVGKAGISRDKIRVSTRGLGLDGVSVPLSETANPYLFLAFVEKATAPKRQQQSGR